MKVCDLNYETIGSLSYCTMFVGNFVLFHSSIGNLLDSDLLFIEDSSCYLFNWKVTSLKKFMLWQLRC